MVPAGALDCLTNTNVTSCTYTYTIGNDGVSTNSTSIANGDVVGYDSTAAIDRVCIPSTKVFDWFNGNSNNETTSTIANSVTGGYLSNLIEDIQHVTSNNNLELAITVGWLRCRHHHQLHHHLLDEMPCRMHRLALHLRCHRFPYRPWFHPGLFWRTFR